MKQFAKVCLSATLLLSAGLALATCSDCTTSTVSDCGCDCATQHSSLFLPRPQYLYSYAQGIFSDPFYYNAETGAVDQCWDFQLGFRYLETWKSDHIAQCLLGSTQLAFVGSQINPTLPANTQYVNADNFGLAADTYRTVTVAPKIQNAIVDFSARWELGGYWDCLESLYAGLETSLVYSRWNLNACEATTLGSEGTTYNVQTTLPACYFGENAVQAFPSVQDALQGGVLSGSMLNEAWKYGAFVFNTAQTDTKLANVTGILGYDFLRCDTYHLGLFARAVAPTGTRPGSDKAANFFSPIIGNGHHWELGGGLDAHWQLWNCDEQSIVAYLNGNATHLFKDKQNRSFDLLTDATGDTQYGLLSRYQLLKGITDGEFNGLLKPGINWTTREVESSFAVQGDASLSLVYYNCNWALGLGYNFYGRSAEKIECSCGCPIEGNWAVAGNSGVCYFVGDAHPSLNATENTARVDNSTFFFADATSAATSNADIVDNATAIDGGTTWASAAAYASIKDGLNAPITLDNSNTAALATCGVPAQMSSTVFAHLDYQWEGCDWKPWLGVGGSCEFAMNGNCKVCTANTWSVWARGGISF